MKKLVSLSFVLILLAGCTVTPTPYYGPPPVYIEPSPTVIIGPPIFYGPYYGPRGNGYYWHPQNHYYYHRR